MGVPRNKVPPHLHARYGIGPRPWPLIVLSAALGIALVGYLLIAVGRPIAAGGDVSLLTWNETDSDTVSVVWSVHRADDAAVTCVLRVQDSDRFDVAYGVVRVQKTGGTPQFETQLRVRGEVYAVPTPVCQPVEPAKSTIPGAHFRPGLLPPAQKGQVSAPWQATPDWLEPRS